ncbi:L,D-transpeptidase [Luteimonas viscosa]|uniref:L,D-transpeptidase n=1 Tax=Luteimonas viscosa TaxID=1132694 RepID=A0A5D4XPF1_9GAMM|nr:L,D-transpeptidase [Luteimonas viscosa]TYT25813.1 L,D-transpeptidase [Luteimonas viscosa]
MRRTTLCVLFLSALLALLPGPACAADPETRAPGSLAPGEYLWHPEISPHGPIVLVVSLDEQRAYVYRNGLAIGVSTISSGKQGMETPTGVFTILQKSRDHRSNLYNDAPMPYMQRLTWDGIALHGGALPGYPASHGCVRLPLEFARRLFAETRNGDTVVVANAKSGAASLAHPALLAPVDERGAQALPARATAGDTWSEDASPTGPVSVLVSLSDRRVFVLRNGIAIGEAALQVQDGFSIGGTVLMVAGEETVGASATAAADRPRRTWSAHPILGPDADAMAMLQLRLQDRPLRVEEAFSRRLRELLVPGTTVLLTDLPAVRPDPSAPVLQPLLDAEGPELARPGPEPLPGD